jgi:hypothetical protein
MRSPISKGDKGKNVNASINQSMQSILAAQALQQQSVGKTYSYSKYFFH